MASLNGTQINNTFPSLLKTTDNAAIDATLKNITDGLGNATPLSMANNYVQLQAPTIELIESTGGTNLMMISPTNVYFEGAVDFASATVTGLPGGDPGLVAGTGTDSIQSADTLTTSGSDALGTDGIALGNNARSRANNCIVIGNGLVDDAIRVNTVVIGSHPTTDTKAAQNSTAVGAGAKAVGDRSIALGMVANSSANFTTVISSTDNLVFTNNEAVFIGNGSGTTFGVGSKNVQIGWDTKGTALNSVAVGREAKATGSWATAIGYRAEAIGEQSTALSYDCNASGQGTIAGGDRASASGSRATALGARSIAALTDSVALGAAVTAVWASGTTVNQLAMANYASINYADDTAAAAGGVPLGGVYHNAGSLRVRIA